MRPLMTPDLSEVFAQASTDGDLPVEACLAMIALLREENASLKKQVDRLSTFRHLAYRDGLTGLYNRRFFDERLAEEWSRAARTDSELAVILIDLDDFKLINDTAGHAAGDKVLSLIGRVMTESCRDYDIPCRLGGDEFAYLLPSTDQDGADKLVERVYEAIAELEHELGLPGTLRVRLSCGVATRREARSAKALLDCADQEMYANKRTRKSAA